MGPVHIDICKDVFSGNRFRRFFDKSINKTKKNKDESIINFNQFKKTRF